MTAGRGLDSFASASAAESQHHALSSQLGTLQAATQKGANRCPSALYPAFAPLLVARCLQGSAVLACGWIHVPASSCGIWHHGHRWASKDIALHDDAKLPPVLRREVSEQKQPGDGGDFLEPDNDIRTTDDAHADTQKQGHCKEGLFLKEWSVQDCANRGNSARHWRGCSRSGASPQSGGVRCRAAGTAGRTADWRGLLDTAGACLPLFPVTLGW